MAHDGCVRAERLKRDERAVSIVSVGSDTEGKDTPGRRSVGRADQLVGAPASSQDPGLVLRPARQARQGRPAGHDPLRVGFYVVLRGHEHPCEAPYSAQVRLRSSRVDDDSAAILIGVDRGDLDRIFRVSTTARWHGRPVQVQAMRLAGVIISGKGRPPADPRVRNLGYTWQLVVDPGELTEVVETETDVLRHRAVWVLDGDRPTETGKYVVHAGRAESCDEPWEGMVRVGETHVLELGEVTAMYDVSTTAVWNGERVTVLSVRGDWARLQRSGSAGAKVPVAQLTDVLEEIREIRLPAPPPGRTERVIRPADSGRVRVRPSWTSGSPTAPPRTASCVTWSGPCM